MNLRLKLIFCICLVTTLIACTDKPSFIATDITGATIGNGSWSLNNAKGQAITAQQLQGKVTAIFFGFTRCPDVCPTTLLDYASALKTMGKDADKVQVIFVTLDPDRDTFPMLQDYVTSFNPNFFALRGDAASTKVIADSFKVYYAKNMGQDGNPQNYTLDHTAASYVFDSQGHIRLYVKHGQTSEQIAKDLQTLLK